MEGSKEIFCEELCRFLLTFFSEEVFCSCLFWWGPQHGRSLCPLRTPLFKEILIKIGRPVGFFPDKTDQVQLILIRLWNAINHTPLSANLSISDLVSCWASNPYEPAVSANLQSHPVYTVCSDSWQFTPLRIGRPRFPKLLMAGQSYSLRKNPGEIVPQKPHDEGPEDRAPKAFI